MVVWIEPKTIQKYIDSYDDRLNKRDCIGVCITPPKLNSNKVKTQVEHIVTKGTKKWILKYIVEDATYDGGEVSSHLSKGDAIKAARAFTEKTQKRSRIYLSKRLDKIDPVVAKITYKSSIKESPGDYVFFGLAPD